MVRASLPALSYPESMHITVQSHGRVAACWWSSSGRWCLAVGRPPARWRPGRDRRRLDVGQQLPHAFSVRLSAPRHSTGRIP